MQEFSRMIRHNKGMPWVIRAIGISAVFLCLLLPSASRGAPAQSEAVKSVIDLQQFKKTTSIAVKNKSGGKGVATLINLNPHINSWFLLTLAWDDGGSRTYHLENNEPFSQEILLDPQFPYGLVIATKDTRKECDLWSGYPKSVLAEVKAERKPFGSLCGGKLYLRNPTTGRKTSKEWVTDFLRDYVWQGERIVNSVKDRFYSDAFLSTSKDDPEKISPGAEPNHNGAPAPALLDPSYENDFLTAQHLGIKIDNETGIKMLAGRWYPAKDLPGIFISVIKPAIVAEEVIDSQRGKVNNLDSVESEALDYLIAFDLKDFDVGFAMGTEHPRVDWSDRVQDKMRDKSLPGPDGIGTVAPLVMTGILPPSKAEWAAATFAGGFRRYHGGFKWGDLALKNHGSHYGFISNGVVLSKLQPGLATFIVYDDGSVDLKTWLEKDNAQLERIRYARQNGVPIVDFDEETGVSMPGSLVRWWGAGNWSGSAQKQLRTLRGSVALQEYKGRKFLIYGYFSTATPSAMARVFQAYRCKYAMLMDMNALEHTYLAVYRMKDSKFMVQHLIQGMDVLDKSGDGQIAPRFVGYADNRDFFYLLRRPH